MREFLRQLRLSLFFDLYDFSLEWRNFLRRSDIVNGEIEFSTFGRVYRAIITKVKIDGANGVRISYKNAKVYGQDGWGELDPESGIPGEHFWVNADFCKPMAQSEGWILLLIPALTIVVFPVGTSQKLPR